jgi:hypothetical protein
MSSFFEKRVSEMGANRFLFSPCSVTTTRYQFKLRIDLHWAWFRAIYPNYKLTIAVFFYPTRFAWIVCIESNSCTHSF